MSIMSTEVKDNIAEDFTPNPSPMLESNRNLGYSIEEAISDLIDNSISAKATEVILSITWNSGTPIMELSDNGCGMNLAKLIESFKLASISPLDPRDPEDLGRFGYGMKTASISQARSLTVISQSVNSKEINARCMDLKFIAKHQKWVLKHTDSGNNYEQYFLEKMHGTIIRWDNWDRAPDDYNSFIELTSQIGNYLSVCFHRFIESGRLNILNQGIEVKPVSPIPDQSQKYSTVRLKEITSKQIAYILKHPAFWEEDYIASRHFNSYKLFDGLEKQQGIYIYRCDRLLTPKGGWFGVVPQNNSAKLARVVINYPNNADHLWSLDITKTNAEIPYKFKKEIKNFIEKARMQSLGKINKRSKQESRTIRSRIGDGLLWTESIDEKLLSWRYSPNISHPVFQNLIRDKKIDKKTMKLIFRLLSESLPVAKIIENNDEDPGRHDRMTGKSNLTMEEISLAKDIYKFFISSMTRQKAIKEITKMEPYCYHQDETKEHLNE